MSKKIILNNDTWARAILASKEFDVENEAKLIESIYTNLGGRFAKEEEKKEKSTKKGEEVKFDDKHTSPETGNKLKKLSDDEDESDTPEGWSKYEDEETQYSRDFRDGAPIYQALRKAQLGAVSDPTVAEPNIESDANQSQNIGNPDILGDEPTPNGLVDKDKDTELRGDKIDNHDVIEAVKDFLTILMVHTDFTSEDILSELKSLFSSDELYNEFKGKLDEAISDKQEDKPVDEQTAQEFLDVMGDEGEEMPVKPAQGPPSAGIVSAILKKAPRKAVLYKKQANKLLSDINIVYAELNEEKQKNKKLAKEKSLLLQERSIRIRYPFSKALASKMYDIGELGHEDEKEVLVKRKAAQLVQLPDSEFSTIESRVEQVHEHLGQNNSNNFLEDEKEKIISYVPNHVTAISKQIEFGKDKEESKWSSSSANKFGWSGGTSSKRRV